MKKTAFLLAAVSLCLLAAGNVMAQRHGGNRHDGGGPNHGGGDFNHGRGGPNHGGYQTVPRSYSPPSPRVQPQKFVPQPGSRKPASRSYQPGPFQQKPLAYAPRHHRPVPPLYQPIRYRHRYYYHGWEPGWWAWPSVWGVNVWWDWGTPDTYVYYNPYVVYVRNRPYDYATPVVVVQENNMPAAGAAQPLVMIQKPEAIATPNPAEGPKLIAPPKPGEVAAETAKTPNDAETMQCFQTAKEQFRKGAYNATVKELDQAIALAPRDTALHELLGLTCFAQGNYNEAAGIINAVIASGPGWDWDTMIDFYGNPDDYTKQLRSLEGHVRQNPTDAAARFLLAYHYLVMDFTDNAAAQLKEVVRLQPKDILSKRILEMLEKSKEASETPKRPTPQG